MTQSTIDIESDAGKHLRLMATGAGWIDVYKRAAADWLVKHGYARWSGLSGRTLYMTIPHYDAENNRIPGPETGLERYEALCRNPAVTASPTAWKEEARSGLAVGSGKLGTVTTRSTIDRACIPKPAGPGTRKTPEDMVDEMQRDMAAQARWCDKLGVTPDELRELGREGRIRMCPACESVGIFDRDRGGWQGKCRKCRKTKRKNGG